MGLLDGVTQKEYYQGNDYGNYQFTSLDDVITQFQIAYVGEDKIISKVKRTDIAFHAQRAMQELSFDTFKSIKSQQIDVPASLTMKLPHDYVNYTKISWADSAGIKHPLYPTSSTSNPFQVDQDDNGNYNFSNATGSVNLNNSDFTYQLGQAPGSGDWTASTAVVGPIISTLQDLIQMNANKLEFTHHAWELNQTVTSRHLAVWQQIDVTNYDYINLKAQALSTPEVSGLRNKGIVRVGISTLVTASQSPSAGYDPNRTNPNLNIPSRNGDANIFNLTDVNGADSYLEWSDGGNTLTSTPNNNGGLEEMQQINVIGINTVWVVITSNAGHHTTNNSSYDNSSGTLTSPQQATVQVDNIELAFEGFSTSLTSTGDSSTWTNYKSATPSENQDDYQDDTYWPANGSRYGLDPQHAQANGSFYMDNRLGKIHFSSNISGKTVILDYISDSLGTDGEMQVHKFAEEAMYKWIAHAILATRANTQEYLVNRFKKERFAAVRTAKLRLSNIKLEEITQILRGKSKQIKH